MRLAARMTVIATLAGMRVALADPAPEASPSPAAVESPEAVASPSPEAVASPSPEAVASPSPEAVASPSPEAVASPAAIPDASPQAEPSATAPRAAPPDPYAGVMRVRLSTHPVVLGLKAGANVPAGRLGPGAGAAIEVRQPFAGGRFGAWIELGWTQSSASGHASGTSAPWTVDVSAIPVVAGAFAREPLPAQLWGYAGLGLAAARTSTVSRAGGGSTVENGLATGFDATAGVERAIGGGMVVVEGGYRFLSSGSRATGAGNLFGPGVRVGYRRAF